MRPLHVLIEQAKVYIKSLRLELRARKLHNESAAFALQLFGPNNDCIVKTTNDIQTLVKEINKMINHIKATDVSSVDDFRRELETIRARVYKVIYFS